MRRNERGRPRDDVHIVPVGKHGVVFTAQETGHFVLAGDGAPIIGGLFLKAALSAAQALMRFVDQRLGGDAGDVDAGAAVHFVRAFDDGDGLSLIREIGGQRLASFPESDNDSVIALLHGIFSLSAVAGFSEGLT